MQQQQNEQQPNAPPKERDGDGHDDKTVTPLPSTDHPMESPVSIAAPSGIPPLTPAVALLKLEQKFKDAMAKCADLSFEKERLEHLVVQLQEETETVGG